MKLIGWIFAGASVVTAVTAGAISLTRGGGKSNLLANTNQVPQIMRKKSNPNEEVEKLKVDLKKYSNCRQHSLMETCKNHLPKWYLDKNSLY